MDEQQQHESNDDHLPLAIETRQVIQHAMHVHNQIGYGFREKTYENALVHLLRKHQIPYEQQPHYPIIFDSVKIDDFIPDLVLHGKFIVDLKTIDRITNIEIGQMMNYLASKLNLALIINFKHPKLEFRRISL